jgi:hypothetical protein
MSDEKHVRAVHHSNRLPARLALDFPVLPCQVVGIVKDEDGRFEADLVLLFVGPVLSFVPGKFHNSLRNDDYVYTLTRLWSKCEMEDQEGIRNVRSVPQRSRL